MNLSYYLHFTEEKKQSNLFIGAKLVRGVLDLCAGEATWWLLGHAFHHDLGAWGRGSAGMSA